MHANHDPLLTNGIDSLCEFIWRMINIVWKSFFLCSMLLAWASLQKPNTTHRWSYSNRSRWNPKTMACATKNLNECGKKGDFWVKFLSGNLPMKSEALGAYLEVCVVNVFKNQGRSSGLKKVQRFSINNFVACALLMYTYHQSKSIHCTIH